MAGWDCYQLELFSQCLKTNIRLYNKQKWLQKKLRLPSACERSEIYVGFTSVDSCDGEFSNTPFTACTGANDRMWPHVACGFQELWITLPAEAWKYSSDISWTHDLIDSSLGSSFQVNQPGVSKGNITCIDSKKSA